MLHLVFHSAPYDQKHQIILSLKYSKTGCVYVAYCMPIVDSEVNQHTKNYTKMYYKIT